MLNGQTISQNLDKNVVLVQVMEGTGMMFPVVCGVFGPKTLWSKTRTVLVSKCRSSLPNLPEVQGQLILILNLISRQQSPEKASADRQHHGSEKSKGGLGIDGAEQGEGGLWVQAPLVADNVWIYAIHWFAFLIKVKLVLHAVFQEQN